MVPSGDWVWLLVSVVGYWCLCVPAGICGCLQVSDAVKWCLRVPTVV